MLSETPASGNRDGIRPAKYIVEWNSSKTQPDHTKGVESLFGREGRYEAAANADDEGNHSKGRASDG